MQTFLPYDSFKKSARVLDQRRLGKQRVECLQILGALTDIHKSDARLDYLEAGEVSSAPWAFRAYDDSIWVWNPNYHGIGWQRHPAVLMWKGYEAALVHYSLAICAEWIARGYNDTCSLKIERIADLSMDVRLAGLTVRGVDPKVYTLPPWLGDEEFHTSHQSNLLQKDPDYYGKFFTCPPGLPYSWPV